MSASSADEVVDEGVDLRTGLCPVKAAGLVLRVAVQGADGDVNQLARASSLEARVWLNCSPFLNPEGRARRLAKTMCCAFTSAFYARSIARRGRDWRTS